MDIKLTHSLLSQFLDTKATPQQIAEKLSLCGPTVDRLSPLSPHDWLYEIEVITNRVDAASAYGIAREAAAILPEFGIDAKCINQPEQTILPQNLPTNPPVKVTVDHHLAPRFACIALNQVTVKPSPKSVVTALEACGERGLNNVIDISNELTLKYGQPVHVFDLDRIQGQAMIVRESRPGEKITTLDGQTHTLPGQDIVIKDGAGRLIDLCGIMGGELSSITPDSTNILLFVQTYEPKHIRRTSLSLQKRTLAAQLFEKQPDPEMVLPVLIEGVRLLQKRAGAVISSSLLDLYPKPIKPSSVSLSLDWLCQFAGIELELDHVISILNRLNINTSLQTDHTILCQVPSYRSNDLKIKQDLAEEIMRVYGYFRLPATIPQTDLPAIPTDDFLNFETQLKHLLVTLGATEVFTDSLVSQALIGQDEPTAFKLANPLSEDHLYMRQRLLPSLIAVRDYNRGSYDKPYTLFEIANTYTKAKKTQLADEIPHLAILWNQTDFRHAKGMLSLLLQQLNLRPESFAIHPESDAFGVEIDLRELHQQASLIHRFRPVPVNQAVIEDLTFTVNKANYADIADHIKAIDPLIESIDLKDVYHRNYTFTLVYRHPDHTLSTEEISPIRKKIVDSLAKENIKLVGQI